MLPEAGIVYTGEIMMDRFFLAKNMHLLKDLSMVSHDMPDMGKILSKLSKLSKLSELSKLAEIPELQGADIDFEELKELEELSKLGEMEECDAIKKLQDLDIDIEIKEGDDEVVIIKKEIKDGKWKEYKELEKTPELSIKERLDAFKLELIDTMLANADAFADSANGEMVTVILQVLDEDFTTVQGAGYLRTQVPAKKLLKYSGRTSADENAVEAFRFNW